MALTRLAACSRYVVAFVLVGCASRGQSTRPATLVRPPPRVRIDVDFAIPAVMVPLGVGIETGTGGVGVGARVATRSGFGGGLSVIGATKWPYDDTTVERVHANGLVVDGTALYRLHPLGDDHWGLGVDLALGFSYATLEWNHGHSAYRGTCPLISFTCMRTLTELYTPPPQGFSSGARAGPVMGLSLDWRSGRFVGGLSAQYRALAYIGALPIAAEPTAVHLLTVQLHVGFGFEP